MDQEKKKFKKRIAIGKDIPAEEQMMMYYWMYNESTECSELMIHSSKVQKVDPQEDHVYVVHTLNTIYIYYKTGEFVYAEIGANIGVVKKVPEARKRVSIDLVTSACDYTNRRRLIKAETVEEIAEDCFKITNGKEVFYVYVSK